MESKRKILVRYRRGDGIRAISRELNISRNTVRDIIRSRGNIKSDYVRVIQPTPRLGDYTEKLEKMLRDNKHSKPKKTGKILFEELQIYGYQGSYSAVSRYIYAWKEKNSEVNINACVPLYFAPGEAYQFDWSSDQIMLGNEIVSVKVAHFVLCYSRKKFVYIYFNETQEMVFDAHVRAFIFFGGTPTKGIYDNMKTAVSKVLKGSNREWNPRFEKLCAHYLVEPLACSPAKGNEKGRVERQVQIDRQQFFTPIPKASTLQELNDILMSRVIAYNSTHHHPEYKDKTIDEAYEQERSFLVSAPVLFDSCKEIDVKVSTTCLVRYENNNYSVHCSCAGKVVQCKVYADYIVFIYHAREVGRHNRKFTKGATSYDWRHYLPILAHKPGALRNGTPFLDMDLPEELKEVRQRLEQHSTGTRDFAHILSYIATESIESVVSACAQAIKIRTISKDAILNILLRKKDETKVSESNNYQEHYTLKHIPKADCRIYDNLLKLGGKS
jgi:transposase